MRNIANYLNQSFEYASVLPNLSASTWTLCFRCSAPTFYFPQEGFYDCFCVRYIIRNTLITFEYSYCTRMYIGTKRYNVLDSYRFILSEDWPGAGCVTFSELYYSFEEYSSRYLMCRCCGEIYKHDKTLYKGSGLNWLCKHNNSCPRIDDIQVTMISIIACDLLLNAA